MLDKTWYLMQREEFLKVESKGQMSKGNTVAFLSPCTNQEGFFLDCLLVQAHLQTDRVRHSRGGVQTG